jgi:uncharacterized integral membrane protein
MKKLKLALILVISLFLALVVVQNTTPVQGRFLWFTAEVPAIILLFLTVAGGFILGLLVAMLIKPGAKQES